MTKPRKAHLHIVLVSVHGPIRGHDVELGRDADTGGQTTNVVELARALARSPRVERVELLTRLVDHDFYQPSRMVVVPRGRHSTASRGRRATNGSCRSRSRSGGSCASRANR